MKETSRSDESSRSPTLLQLNSVKRTETRGSGDQVLHENKHCEVTKKDKVTLFKFSKGRMVFSISHDHSHGKNPKDCFKKPSLAFSELFSCSSTSNNNMLALAQTYSVFPISCVKINVKHYTNLFRWLIIPMFLRVKWK